MAAASKACCLRPVLAQSSFGSNTHTPSVNNLFGAQWNEAQFATTSRLRGEPMEVTELHFTPGARRTVQLGLEYRF
ncbi:hypothetical protein BH24GEM2_BH24GEM2_18320 [soil metagenome]